MNPDVKIVLASGLHPDSIEKTMTECMDGFLQKPYRLKGLVALLHDIFGKQREESRGSDD